MSRGGTGAWTGSADLPGSGKNSVRRGLGLASGGAGGQDDLLQHAAIKAGHGDGELLFAGVTAYDRGALRLGAAAHQLGIGHAGISRQPVGLMGVAGDDELHPGLHQQVVPLRPAIGAVFAAFFLIFPTQRDVAEEDLVRGGLEVRLLDLLRQPPGLERAEGGKVIEPA